MLNFDNSHKSINENINKRNGKMVRGIAVAELVVIALCMFSGCAKTVPCDIRGSHAHYYSDSANLGRYIISEKTSISGLERTDDYIIVDSKEDRALLEFINKKGLFKISDNKQAIGDIVGRLHDHVEYRYEYFYLLPMVLPGANGSLMISSMPMVGHSWTSDTDSGREFTGEERICHYVYCGYKVVPDGKGGYQLLKSEPVDDLSLLPEGYDYVKEKFYDAVDGNNRNKPLDYEDGPIEDKQIITEEEYNSQIEESNGSKKSK